MLGAHRSLGHLAEPVLERGDGLRDSLDEVVDLVVVVPAPLLAELDVAELLGRQLHAVDANARLVRVDGPSIARASDERDEDDLQRE